MRDTLSGFFKGNIPFLFLAGYEKEYNEIYARFLEAPEELRGNEELATKLYEMMKEIDTYGFQFENLARYEDALLFYKHALKYLLLSYELVWDVDAYHHLAICELTIARTELALAELSDFEATYKRYLARTSAALSDPNLTHDPVLNMRNQVRELFEKSPIIYAELFSELIVETMQMINEVHEEELIKDYEFHSLLAMLDYLLIIFVKEDNEVLLEQHLSLINLLIDNLGAEQALKLVYEQFDTLLHAPYVPTAYKAKYRAFYALLYETGETKDTTIRIFISSVFRDFQKERDIIQNVVLPEMKDFCLRKYGLDFEIIDLRWGIELNEHLSEFETMYKVLSVCGEMIKKAHPYFLLFVSDEYGTEVAPELVNQIYPFLGALKPVSITEVEYLLRTYEDEKLDDVLLFAKNKASITNKEVLGLISNIETKLPSAKWLSYTADAENLAALIIKALKAKITKNHAPQQVYDKTEFKLEQLASKMVGFKDHLDFALSKLREENRMIFALNSPIGGGKSTFLAKLYTEAKKAGSVTFAFLTKDYDYDVTEFEFMMFVKDSLEALLEIERAEQESVSMYALLNEIKALVKALPKEMRIVFFVDDYDLLIPSSELLAWITTDFRPLQFVVSVTQATALLRLISTGAIPIQLREISDDDFKLFVTKKFHDHFKVANQSLVDRLHLKFTKENLTINPLYLNALIDHLIYIDARDYQNIYDDIKTDQITFKQAIMNYQRLLIYEFPLSLEAYAEEKLKAYIKQSKEHEFLLAALAFTYLTGISLNELNTLFKAAKHDYTLSSFIDLKFELGSLIEVNEINYAKIRHEFVARKLFKLLRPEILNLLAALIRHKMELFPYSPVIRSYMHFNEYTELVTLFTNGNYLLKGVISRELLYSLEDEQYIFNFIAEVELDRNTLFFFHTLYTDHIELATSVYPLTFKFLSAIITRLEQELDRYEDKEQIYNFYAIFAKELLEHTPKKEEENVFNHHYDFIKNNLGKFNVNNPFIINYFSSFVVSIRRSVFNFSDILSDFYELVFEPFNVTQITWLDARFAFIKLAHLLGWVFGVSDVPALQLLIELYDVTYGEKLDLDKLDGQIDLLFFIAEAATARGQREEAFKYYRLLRRALYHESLAFPNTTKLIKIRSTTTNNLAANYISDYLNEFYHDPAYFDRTDDEFKVTFDYVEGLILETVFTAQTTFNASHHTESLVNNNVSNLNYSIFYATFAKEPLKAIQNLSSSIVNTVSQFEHHLFDHRGVINALLYNQIFLDYYGLKVYDSLAIFDLYKTELAKYNPPRETLNAESIFSFTNMQLQVMRLEKSETYVLLERAVIDFINYLATLPPA